MECDTGIFKKTLNGSKQNADKLIIEATTVFNVLHEFDSCRNRIIIFPAMFHILQLNYKKTI